MKHLPSLNGLRAISILIVWICHLKLQYSFLAGYTSILTDGQFAVNIFFVISGFLITSILLNEEEKTGDISLKRFYYRRTLRIFPAYYFILIVYFVLVMGRAIPKIPLDSWITSLTYMKYFNWYGEHYTSHFWSLSVEEHFYLLWPILFIKFKDYRNVILLTLIAIPPILKVIGNYHDSPYLNDLTLFYRIDSIATGCFVAVNLNKILSIIKGSIHLFFIAAIVVLAALPFIGIELNLKYHLHIGFIVTAFFRTYGTIANICIAIILLYSIYGGKGLWFRFLNTRIMNQVGLWSYSMYLWHMLFFAKTNKWFNEFPLNIILALAASIGSYYLIEKPFLKLRDIKKAAIEAA